jgi:hypothetical protein
LQISNFNFKLILIDLSKLPINPFMFLLNFIYYWTLNFLSWQLFCTLRWFAVLQFLPVIICFEQIFWNVDYLFYFKSLFFSGKNWHFDFRAGRLISLIILIKIVKSWAFSACFSNAISNSFLIFSIASSNEVWDIAWSIYLNLL